jgi:hypothetical protein
MSTGKAWPNKNQVKLIFPTCFELLKNTLSKFGPNNFDKNVFGKEFRNPGIMSNKMPQFWNLNP